MTTTSVQNHLDLDQLPRYQKRRFLPDKIDLTDVEQVKGRYAQMLERAIGSPQEFEQWILDRSELEAAVDQQRTILYIRMTCQTDHEAFARDHKNFIKNVVPVIQPLEDLLNKKYLAGVNQFELSEKYYEVYHRSIRTDVELFVEKNVPLQTQLALLSQEYQTLEGSLTVLFEGRERTLPQMKKFLAQSDRSLRESAWKAAAKRRLQEKDRLDEIFDKMLLLRNQTARNAHYPNFCLYKFRALHRFDYTLQDCKKYHETIERMVVPLWAQILDHRRRQMGLNALRPWDTEVDPSGRPPLKPFAQVEDLIKGCQKAFEQVDPQLGQQFSAMARQHHLDLASHKGKAPGGYQSTLNEARRPFIFMNAVGMDDDVWTLFHEGGHAFHVLACAHEPLLAYRHGPMEFNEVASMAMELLAGEYLSIFYPNPEDKRRSRRDHLEGIIFLLIWVATIDAFQHWIYENPEHKASQRREAWLRIRRRFGGDLLDWTGLEEEHRFLWQRQLHIFEAPFYYIEYGIAQLGALQLWLMAKNDWKDAVKKYRQGLALGGSKPLPELFAASGMRFDFSAATIAPLMKAVQNELEAQGCH